MSIRLFIKFTLVIAIASFNEYAAAQSCHPLDDTDIFSQETPVRIGKIRIYNGDLFNHTKSNQNRLVHRLSNSLHLKTLKKAIFAAIPMRTGDTYSEALLAETERALRSKRYIRDASVSASEQCESGVVIDIHTIDNWTLTPSISYGRAGGDNTYTVELQDLNFLGTGKQLKLRDRQSGDLRESTFIYNDDNILGGRHQIRLELGDNDEGKLFELNTGLPFYSDNSIHSWRLHASTESLAYSDSKEPDQLTPVLTERIELGFSRRLNHSVNSSLIVGGGLRYARQSTEPDKTIPTLGVATDYHDLYPFISTSWYQHRWIKKQNVEKIRVNEDINLGFSFHTEVGVIAKGFGSNQRSRLRLQTGLSKGWQFSKQAFHRIDVGHVQYISADDRKHAISGRYRYFRWLTQNDLLNIRLTAEGINGYSPIHNKLVGGDHGLKAYSNRFQQGENRVIGLLEYRHITNWSPYSLVNTAVSVFAESGQAWTRPGTAKPLANIGIGFLLAPTRSSTAAINRFEIVMPLVHGEDVGNYQFFVGTKVNY